MKTNAKILVWVLLTVVLVFTAATGIISWNFRQMARANAEKLAMSIARQSALSIKADLATDMEVTRTIANTFQGFKKIPDNLRDSIYDNILIEQLRANPNYLSVWTSWELSAINPTWTKNYGRKKIEVFLKGGVPEIKKDSANITGDIIGSPYHQAKISGMQAFTPPYYYSYDAVEQTGVLMASVATPIMYKNKFVGLVGIDAPLGRFQTLTDNIKPYNESFAFVIASNSKYVTHPNKKYINQLAITDLEPEEASEFSSKIKNGIEFFETKIINNKDYYIAYSPFSIGTGTLPWSVGVAIPYNAIYKEANNNLYLAIGIGLAGIFIVSIIVYIIALQISRPIVQTTAILKEIEKGKIPRVKNLRIKGKDEIAEMGRSVSTLIDTLHQTVSFAEAISQNKFDTKYKLLSDEDALGNALLNMQTNLKIADKEREQRQQQELRERWETSGYAEFAEILRLNANNLSALAFSTISAIAAKLEAPAGAIYLVNEDNTESPYIECIATYGYESPDKSGNKIEIGEGMIGSCVLEKELINASNLPSDYFKISSFSGKSIPSSVLIVPLILGNKVWGVMEIAGFKSFEPYKISFIQKISENIASAIYAQRNSEKTIQLLEEANIQAEKILEKERILREHTSELELLRGETEKQKAELEKMRSAIAVREFELQQKTKSAEQKEEEIEQTMRNLVLAQKTADNRHREIIMLTSAIDKALMRAIYGIDGKIIEINDRFSEITGFTKEQLVGKHLSHILDTNDESFSKVWNDVKLGIPFSGKLFRKLKNGIKRTFLITYTPVFDDKNNVTQVYYLGYPLD